MQLGGLAAAIVLVGLTACKRAEVAQDDEHAHESATAQFTVLNDDIEVFVEHPPVVAGAPAKFTTHVSNLRTLEPRQEGPARFVLKFGDESPIEHVEPQPARAGIYEPMLKFPKPGRWDVSLVIPTQGGDSQIQFPKVAVYATEHDADHAEMPEPPDGIAFLKEQQWRIRLGTDRVGKKTLVQRISLPALAQAKPGLSATIVAPVTGQLTEPASGALSIPGTKVEAGQVLALVRPTFSEAASKVIDAESEFAQAQAAFTQAEIAFERIQKLRAAEAKSQRELQEAELALALARARLQAATVLRSTYTGQGLSTSNVTGGSLPVVEIPAPISGTINSLAAGLGEPVQAGQTLFTILNTAMLWLEASVPEAHINRLASAKGATYTLATAPGAFADITRAGGRLVFMGRRVDPATRTVPLVYELPNPEGKLLVGQTLTLHVETDQAPETIAIPETAVVDEGGLPVAFVQIAGETFLKRNLTLGIKDSGWIQVLAGLEEGERVVTAGAFALRLASLSGALPSHGHAH